MAARDTHSPSHGDFSDFEDGDRSYILPDALPVSARGELEGGEAGFDVPTNDRDDGFDTDYGMAASADAHDDAHDDHRDDLGGTEGGDAYVGDYGVGEQFAEDEAPDEIHADAEWLGAPASGLKSWVRKPANIATLVAGLGLAGFMAYQVVGTYQRLSASTTQAHAPTGVQGLTLTPATQDQPGSEPDPAEIPFSKPDNAQSANSTLVQASSLSQVAEHGVTPTHSPSYDGQAAVAGPGSMGLSAEGPVHQESSSVIAGAPAGSPAQAPAGSQPPVAYTSGAPSTQFTYAVPSAVPNALPGQRTPAGDSPSHLSESQALVALLSAQLDEQMERVAALERANEAVVSALNELKEELVALNKHAAAASSAQIAKAEGQQARASRPQAPARREPPTYEFIGGVEDAVWIRSSSGSLVKISVGDRLAGYGKVVSVDKRGSIVTEAGPVKLSRAATS